MELKNRITGSSKKKATCHVQGAPIELTVDFLAEILQANRDKDNAFKALKEENLQPRILCLAKLSFRNEGKIKTFPYKQKLIALITARLALEECKEHPSSQNEERNTKAYEVLW